MASGSILLLTITNPLIIFPAICLRIFFYLFHQAENLINIIICCIYTYLTEKCRKYFESQTIQRRHSSKRWIKLVDAGRIPQSILTAVTEVICPSCFDDAENSRCRSTTPRGWQMLGWDSPLFSDKGCLGPEVTRCHEFSSRLWTFWNLRDV